MLLGFIFVFLVSAPSWIRTRGWSSAVFVFLVSAPSWIRTRGWPSAVPMSNGHITVKAPHPIRTAKLSTVELDQYFGRGLQGNLQCCWAIFFFFLHMRSYMRPRGRICDLAHKVVYATSEVVYATSEVVYARWLQHFFQKFH